MSDPTTLITEFYDIPEKKTAGMNIIMTTLNQQVIKKYEPISDKSKCNWFISDVTDIYIDEPSAVAHTEVLQAFVYKDRNNSSSAFAVSLCFGLNVLLVMYVCKCICILILFVWTWLRCFTCCYMLCVILGNNGNICLKYCKSGGHSLHPRINHRTSVQ